MLYVFCLVTIELYMFQTYFRFPLNYPALTLHYTRTTPTKGTLKTFGSQQRICIPTFYSHQHRDLTVCLHRTAPLTP